MTINTENQSETSFLINDIREYIKKRRTCSIRNLSEIFDTPFDSLVTLIHTLEMNSQVRIVQSSCSGSCSSCTTCGPQNIDSNAIVISLDNRVDENDC